MARGTMDTSDSALHTRGANFPFPSLPRMTKRALGKIRKIQARQNDVCVSFSLPKEAWSIRSPFEWKTNMEPTTPKIYQESFPHVPANHQIFWGKINFFWRKREEQEHGEKEKDKKKKGRSSLIGWSFLLLLPSKCTTVFMGKTYASACSLLSPWIRPLPPPPFLTRALSRSQHQIVSSSAVVPPNLSVRWLSCQQ